MNANDGTYTLMFLDLMSQAMTKPIDCIWCPWWSKHGNNYFHYWLLAWPMYVPPYSLTFLYSLDDPIHCF